MWGTWIGRFPFVKERWVEGEEKGWRNTNSQLSDFMVAYFNLLPIERCQSATHENDALWERFSFAGRGFSPTHCWHWHVCACVCECAERGGGGEGKNRGKSRRKAGEMRAPTQSFLSTLSDIRFIAHTQSRTLTHTHGRTHIRIRTNIASSSSPSF